MSIFFFFFLLIQRSPTLTLFPYTTLFRSHGARELERAIERRHERARAVLHVEHEAGESFRELLAHRSEEHTSELQSRVELVCRLLLEKKKNSGLTCSNAISYSSGGYCYGS